MLLIEIIVRLKRNKHPSRLLTVSMNGNSRRGRPFRTIRHTFADNMKTITPEADNRGIVGDCVGYAMNVA